MGRVSYHKLNLTFQIEKRSNINPNTQFKRMNHVISIYSLKVVPNKFFKDGDDPEQIRSNESAKLDQQMIQDT